MFRRNYSLVIDYKDKRETENNNNACSLSKFWVQVDKILQTNIKISFFIKGARLEDKRKLCSREKKKAVMSV